MQHFFDFLVWPLLAIIVVTVVLVLAGQGDLASVVARAGTALVLLWNVIFIVFIDSRKRWPGVPWLNRLANFFTFTK